MALRSDRLDAVVNLSKRRGFVYPSSEIYGGLRAAWDYGPLGVELKNNVKRQWWRYMVQERDDIVGLDSSVILAREGGEESGHAPTPSSRRTRRSTATRRRRGSTTSTARTAGSGASSPSRGTSTACCARTSA